MSKGFDYSKWDNIELSDDEDDVHPNIDRESWFRLKHRSRVEREEKEEKDTKKIQQEVCDKPVSFVNHSLTIVVVASGKVGVSMTIGACHILIAIPVTDTEFRIR